MKVAVLGAGAIGAYVGAALYRAGADVHLIARGPHLAAMRRHGVRVVSPRGDFTARAHATDDPAEAGPVDYVFLGLKANSYAACGPLIEPLLASSVDLSTTPRVAGWIKDYEAKPDRFGPDAARLGEEPKVDNELYVRDYDKCILCYKCVDACGDQWQNSFAISVAGRGFDARIAVEHDAPLTDSACVYCGNCIEVCPTGALSFKSEFDMRAAGTWDESAQTEATTVCAYCGVGCNLTLHVQDNGIVKVTSPHDNPVTHGNLCIKGRFGYQHVQNRD